MDRDGLEKAIRAGLALADGVVQNATREDQYTLAAHAHRQLTPFLAELSDAPSGNVKFENVYGDRRAEIEARATRERTNPEADPRGIPPTYEELPDPVGVGSAAESAPLPPSRGDGAAISPQSQATKASRDAASIRAEEHRRAKMGPETQPGKQPGDDESDRVVARPPREPR